MLYGRTSGAVSYTSGGGTQYITRGISQDGATINNNAYDATTYSWTGGTPIATGSTNIESCQPTALNNGWGAATNTYAAISMTSPADTYHAAFFVHNYYTSADLEVRKNGTLIGAYDNIMSSSYTAGGGEARNTDFYYDLSLQNLTAGDVFQFKFTDLQNLGSDWSNIAFMSASVDFTPPTSISNNLVTLTASPVPEPASVALIMLGGLGLLARRRRATTTAAVAVSSRRRRSSRR